MIIVISRLHPPVDNHAFVHNPVEALPDPEKFLHSEFTPVKLMSNMCDLFFSSFSGLSCFVRASLSGTTRTVEGHSSSDLWPVPPPRWRWTADAHPNPRRRRRRRYLEVRHKMLQIVIASLNWTALGTCEMSSCPCSIRGTNLSSTAPCDRAFRKDARPLPSHVHFSRN